MTTTDLARASELALGVHPSALNATRKLIDELGTRKLPTNENGEIQGYYDPSSLQPDVEPTLIPLVYQDKIAYQPDGSPFWERLEGESTEHFQAFQQYLYFAYGIVGPPKEGTAETAATLRRHPQLKDQLSQQRNLHDIAALLKAPVDSLATIAALYAWQYRAKEFDLYVRRSKELRMEQEVSEMESTHAKIARRIIDKVGEALDQMEPEELTPQAIKDWLTAGVQLERVSRQVDPTKPSPIGGIPTGPQGRPRKNGDSDGVQVHNADGGTVQIQVVYTDDWRSS